MEKDNIGTNRGIFLIDYTLYLYCKHLDQHYQGRSICYLSSIVLQFPCHVVLQKMEKGRRK